MLQEKDKVRPIGHTKDNLEYGFIRGEAYEHPGLKKPFISVYWPQIGSGGEWPVDELEFMLPGYAHIAINDAFSVSYDEDIYRVYPITCEKTNDLLSRVYGIHTDSPAFKLTDRNLYIYFSWSHGQKWVVCTHNPDETR